MVASLWDKKINLSAHPGSTPAGDATLIYFFAQATGSTPSRRRSIYLFFSQATGSTTSRVALFVFIFFHKPPGPPHPA